MRESDLFIFCVILGFLLEIHGKHRKKNYFFSFSYRLVTGFKFQIIKNSTNFYNKPNKHLCNIA